MGFVLEKSSCAKICSVFVKTPKRQRLKSLCCQKTYTGKIAIENPRQALLFIVVLLKNVVHSYTNALLTTSGVAIDILYILDSASLLVKLKPRIF
jgi:hypothetical protein